MLLSTAKVNDYQERSNPLLFLAKKEIKIEWNCKIFDYSCCPTVLRELHCMVIDFRNQKG